MNTINENQTKIKKKAAVFSIFSNSILILFKFFAGVISGSISIISEAIHSFSDLLASLLTYFAVSKSSEPKDKEHQFGHGKYEDLSGLIEGILIIFASFFIIYESVKKIIFKDFLIENNLTICIFVMAISVILNVFISFYLFRVAKKTDSLALFADAEHLRTDIYSSFGVLLGFVVIQFTQIYILDPIIAIIIAVIIFQTGINVSKKASNNLLDTTLPKDEMEKIFQILKKCMQILNFEIKEIKTRKSGMRRNIEITILLNANYTIKQSHQICDCIEQEIENIFNNTDTLIHIEPKV